MLIEYNQPPKLVWQMENGLPNPCDNIPICKVVEENGKKRVVLVPEKIGPINFEKLCAEMPLGRESRITWETCIGFLNKSGRENATSASTYQSQFLMENGMVALGYEGNIIGHQNEITVSHQFLLEKILEARTGKPYNPEKSDFDPTKYICLGGVLTGVLGLWGLKKGTDSIVKSKHEKFLRDTGNLPAMESAKATVNRKMRQEVIEYNKAPEEE